MRHLILLSFALSACSSMFPPAEVTPGGPGVPGEPVDFGLPAPPSCPASTTPAPDGPPPLSGGTLLGLADGKTVVASDPDNDLLWVVDSTSTTPPTSIALQAHDEPGRLVQDAAGRVHVALRRGGALVTINPQTATVLMRRSVCPAPRGLAYDSASDLVHVACAGGELVSLPAAGGAATRTLQLDDDLRDVMLVNGQLMVSRFRSAELLTLDASGNVAVRRTPASINVAAVPGGGNFTPSVAWRTISLPSGQVLMLHQRGTTDTIDVPAVGVPLPPSPTPGPGPVDMASGGGPSMGGGAYGGSGDSCSGNGPVVQSTLSVFDATSAGAPPLGALMDVVLAVDVAVSTDGTTLGIVAPGNVGNGPFRPMSITSQPLSSLDPACLKPGSTAGLQFTGVPVAITALGGRWAVQLRDPSMIVFLDGSFTPTGTAASLGNSSTNAGHQLFHSDAGGSIACASCHPEGGDDGRVWNFNFGARRTMSLRGGVRGTEPFHWSGDEADISALMSDVFVNRMHGNFPGCDGVNALADWIESIPTVSAAVDAQAVSRGQALFQDPSVGCNTCHTGPHFTNNQTVDVGTGGLFQVPRLTNVGAHGPWLHDGRAQTLQQRFDPSLGGGDQHGHTSQLTSSQIDDLVAYLRSL